MSYRAVPSHARSRSLNTQQYADGAQIAYRKAQVAVAKIWKSKVTRKVVAITSIAATSVFAAHVALLAVGFGTTVAAGSLAASYQSAFLGGTIAKGSVFAICQSTGALLCKTKWVLTGLAGATHQTVKAVKRLATGDDIENAEIIEAQGIRLPPSRELTPEPLD